MEMHCSSGALFRYLSLQTVFPGASATFGDQKKTIYVEPLMIQYMRVYVFMMVRVQFKVASHFKELCIIEIIYISLQLSIVSLKFWGM